MPYKIANNTEVKVSINAESIDKKTPSWNLSDWSLWAGDFEYGYDLEKLAANSIGSSSWLWSSVDTMLFSQQSKALFAVALKVPDLLNFSRRILKMKN